MGLLLMRIAPVSHGTRHIEACCEKSLVGINPKSIRHAPIAVRDRVVDRHNRIAFDAQRLQRGFRQGHFAKASSQPVLAEPAAVWPWSAALVPKFCGNANFTSQVSRSRREVVTE